MFGERLLEMVSELLERGVHIHMDYFIICWRLAKQNGESMHIKELLEQGFERIPGCRYGLGSNTIAWSEQIVAIGEIVGCDFLGIVRPALKKEIAWRLRWLSNGNVPYLGHNDWTCHLQPAIWAAHLGNYDITDALQKMLSAYRKKSAELAFLDPVAMQKTIDEYRPIAGSIPF